MHFLTRKYYCLKKVQLKSAVKIATMVFRKSLVEINDTFAFEILNDMLPKQIFLFEKV
jgi:hypothetical protein